MVDVSDTKGGAVLVSMQPISSSALNQDEEPEESWAVVDHDSPVKAREINFSVENM